MFTCGVLSCFRSVSSRIWSCTPASFRIWIWKRSTSKLIILILHRLEQGKLWLQKLFRLLTITPYLYILLYRKKTSNYDTTSPQYLIFLYHCWVSGYFLSQGKKLFGTLYVFSINKLLIVWNSSKSHYHDHLQ